MARRRTGRRRSRRRRSSSMRSVLVVLHVFLAVAYSLAVLVPGSGFVSSVHGFLTGALGYLNVFPPLLLLVAAAGLLGLDWWRGAFRAVAGAAVTGYFLAAVLDLSVSRLSPGFHDVPGGTVAGGIGELLVPLTGAPVAYLVLFTAFVTSLVSFTGWDLTEDLRELAERASGMLGRLRSGRRGRPAPVRRRRKREPAEEPAEAEGNVWAREKEDPLPVRELPFEGREPGPATDPPKEPTGERTASGGRRSSGKSGGQRKSVGPGETTMITVQDGEREFVLPPLSCLDRPPERGGSREQREMIRDQGELLLDKLSDFGIECRLESTHPGPVITRFEVAPGPGVKVNRFVSLSDDLALALKAKRVRILAPIPGKGAVGIEVPNPDPETVHLVEIMESIRGERLPMAMGKKIEGEPFVADLCDMPHLLIAGATGSGKSVCIHAIIASLLLQLNPSQVRLAMIDPKMLELSIYQDIPHLWAPVVLETKKSKLLLDALVHEMETRYQRLARNGVRSISEFNARLTEESEDERIPYIVLVIDELADLMVTCANDIEPPITRLAQMARAVGIHLILATQRPSVDVITGVIKANFPSRIAFNVQSKTDSRTILDMNGAEKLLGKGDMLFLPAASPEPVRVHGSYISTAETRALVEHLKEQPRPPYEFEPPDETHGNLADPADIQLSDPLFEKAKQVVVQTQQGSVSIIQRRLRVGYSRAASLIDMLEQAGVVGPFQGSRAREVLIEPETEADLDPTEDR